MTDTERNSISLAYLVSQYPRFSETFILREIRRLRATGFRIHVASINNPDRLPERLTEAEKEEFEQALYIKQAGAVAALRDHLFVFRKRPAAWCRGLVFALRLAGWDLKKMLFSLFYFAEAAIVGRWMQGHGLSHLHVHFATPASTVGLIATRVFPISLSITVHGPDEFYDAPGYRLREKIQGSAFVCCIGSYARSQLMKLSPHDCWDKLEISPLGIDPHAFSPRPFRENPHPFEVLCVGRLVPAKGQLILIKAIEQLVRSGRIIRLRLVGDGPDRTALEAEVGKRGLGDYVVFEGAVDQDRIRDFYRGADVFALASFAEGIPVVLMEAMAMEIPCVTTFITGIPELIRPEQDGLLVAPSDEQALAAALARLMDDATLRRRLGEAGRRRVLEKYDLNHNTERLAAIFRRRLGEL